MNLTRRLLASPHTVAILLAGSLLCALGVVVFVPQVIEARAVAQLQREQDLMTAQTATILSNRVAEVQRRLQFAELTKPNEALLEQLERPWDADTGVFLFVHDERGEVLAVDRRFDPKMVDRFSSHKHEARPKGADVHICEKCLDKMQAVSVGVRRPDGTRLVASIDVERLAGGALTNILGEAGGHAVLRDSERQIFAVGAPIESPVLRSEHQVEGTPWSIVVATPERLTSGLRRDLAVLGALGALIFIMLLLSVIAHYRAATRLRDERDRVERELTAQSRMATLGLLSASLSHEINNALHIAMTYAWAARDTTDPAEQQEFLGEVEDALANIERIARDTLGFARTNDEPTEFDLEEVVHEALRVVAPRLKHARVVTNCEDGGIVTGNRGNLTQVVVNLLLNAVQAMDAQPGEISIDLDCDTDVVRLAVSDDGPGIDGEIVEDLFSPLATTKSTGTGLGLWLSRRIVTQHGGTISAEALRPHGARFVITLPRTDRVARAA